MRKPLISNNQKLTLKILLKQLNYPYLEKYYQILEEHPNFPSFLSLHFLLKKLNIDNIALRSDYDELQHKLPKPLVVHAITNVELFLVLAKVDEHQVYVINDKNKYEIIPKDSFLKMWTKNVLIVDTENINYKIPSLKEHFLSKLEIIRKPFLLLSFIFILICLVFNNGLERNILNYIYLCLYSIGICLATLLLTEQFDKNKILLKKYCTPSSQKNIDCESVLDSKGAYFLGIFSWSDLGFIFFIIHFLIILLFPVEFANSIAIIISFPASIYVFYSLYYQKFVIKNWCKLCLWVQATLVALFIISLIAFDSNVFHKIFYSKYLWSYSLLILFIIISYVIIKPLIFSKLKYPILKKEHKNLIHDPSIINLIQNKYPSIPSDNIYKIELGNINACNSLTVVFSPICSPCIKELNKIFSFITDEKNLKIYLVFLIADDDNSTATIALNLLKEYIKDKQSFINVMKTYIDNFPNSKNQYVNEQIADEAINEILLSHLNWCKKNKIYNTPTLIMNDRYLSPIYTLDDVDYMFI